MIDTVEIPQTLDAPPLAMVFDATQFALVMVGAMMGLIFGYVIPFLIAGYMAGSIFTKYADTKPKGFVLHTLYWWGLPLLNPNYYPHSFDREYRP